jgi:hypothetical protein
LVTGKVAAKTGNEIRKISKVARIFRIKESTEPAFWRAVECFINELEINWCESNIGRKQY